MQTARQSGKKIRRAITAARFEGYCVAICGGLTALGGLGSLWPMLGGVVLTVIGVIEIVAASKMSRLDPAAPKILTANQLVLAGVILLYALWNLHAEIAHPQSDFPDLSPSDAQVLGQYEPPAMSGLTHEVMMILYGSMILAAVAEAGMAAYYHSRGSLLKQYLAETPPWIIELQRAGVRI
jgi:hypothetical protein